MSDVYAQRVSHHPKHHSTPAGSARSSDERAECVCRFELVVVVFIFFFFFNDPATPEIYPLSLHDALPICSAADSAPDSCTEAPSAFCTVIRPRAPEADRKSTRLNSSNGSIPNAAFCLKKKNTTPNFRDGNNDHVLPGHALQPTPAP